MVIIFRSPFRPRSWSKICTQELYVAGARVRSLADRMMPAGEYRLTWDGTNDQGRDLASGAYFYRLEADGDVQAKKLILLR